MLFKKTITSIFMSGLLATSLTAHANRPVSPTEFLPTFDKETILGIASQFNYPDLSKGIESGFYSFEEYKEKREKEEKVSVEKLFKGLVVNTVDGKIFKNQDLITQSLQDIIDSNSLEEHSQSDLTKLRFINVFSKMVGFSLFNEKQELQDTLFLIIDYDENPSLSDDFLTKVYFSAKKEGKNVIVYPISLSAENDGFKIGFNNLKARSLTKPEKLNLLNQRSYEGFFDIKTTADLSEILYNGIVSNTLTYLTDIQGIESIALFRIDKKWDMGVLTGNEMFVVEDFISGVDVKEIQDKINEVKQKEAELNKPEDPTVNLEKVEPVPAPTPPTSETKVEVEVEKSNTEISEESKSKEDK